MKTPTTLFLAAAFGFGTLTIAAPLEPEMLGLLKTVNGKIYEQAKITQVDPDGIRIRHKDGAAKVAFTQLPTELQEKYSYSPVKAAAYTQEQAAAADKVQQRDRVVQQLADVEAKQSEFQVLRKSFLKDMLSGKNLADLLTQMEYQIQEYETGGDRERAKLLKDDLALLTKRMANQPSQAEQLHNQKLENEITSLRNQLREVETSRRIRTVYVPSSPFSNFSNTSYVVPQSVYYPVPVAVPYCPTPQVVPYCPAPQHQHQGGHGGNLLPQGNLLLRR